jgi:hypothetical protein
MILFQGFIVCCCLACCFCLSGCMLLINRLLSMPAMPVSRVCWWCRLSVICLACQLVSCPAYNLDTMSHTNVQPYNHIQAYNHTATPSISLPTSPPAKRDTSLRMPTCPPCPREFLPISSPAPPLAPCQSYAHLHYSVPKDL